MCGIAGYVAARHGFLDEAIVSLAHRGPDEQGRWTGERAGWNVGLGQTRLSILDLSPAAHQPMWDDTGQVALVYNGEIYNFRELRSELDSRGHAFRSSSDTEVLLRGYLQHGREVVQRLRGMFAFAVWDGRDGSLFLARDRIGIKPLYLARLGDGVAFASELSALFALGVEPRMAPGTPDRFLTYLYIPGPDTAYEGVEELLPAHTLTWRDGHAEVEPYWSLPSAEAQGRADFQGHARALRSTLEEIVEQHMVADVPLGAFLSGGLDSGTLVGLMAQKSRRPVKTFCMTFGEGEELYDEREYARIVAEHFATEHHEIPVHPNLVELLPRLVEHFGQPFGNPTALLSYELSRQTREHVTVALAGDGGDEIFLGYPRYAGARMSGFYRRVPAPLRKLANRVALPLIPESTQGRHELRRIREFLAGNELPAEAMYASWVGYFDAKERRDLLTQEHRASPAPEAFLAGLFDAHGHGELVERASRVDLQSFLPNNLLTYSDRMSMAHSLELRVPYCDHVLVEQMCRLPASIRMRRGGMKALFKESVADLLPPRVVRRRKLGFNPPMGIWLNRDLGPLVGELLSPQRLAQDGIFRSAPIERMLAEHRSGKRDYSLHLWALLVFQVWYQQLGRAGRQVGAAKGTRACEQRALG